MAKILLSPDAIVTISSSEGLYKWISGQVRINQVEDTRDL